MSSGCFAFPPGCSCAYIQCVKKLLLWVPKFAHYVDILPRKLQDGERLCSVGVTTAWKPGQVWCRSESLGLPWLLGKYSVSEGNWFHRLALPA